jgi:hypothetical protein
MGFLDTIKGWFNIGGVKVKLQGVGPTVSKAGSSLSGSVTLTSKSDKHILGLRYRFFLKKTTGRGNEKETKEFTLGEARTKDEFDLKAGESKTMEFTLPYGIEKTLKDMGGVLGGIGKLASFASAEKLEYFVRAEASVKGAAFSPGDSVSVTVTD